MRSVLNKRLAAELFERVFLVAVVVGSGIMAERLTNGHFAFALRANTMVAGAALVALILTLGPISGAHLNQALACGCNRRQLGLARGIVAQLLGGLGGTLAAPGMFGLLRVIWGCSRSESYSGMIPFAVGSHITAAYLVYGFYVIGQSSRHYLRLLSDVFAGLRPTKCPHWSLLKYKGDYGHDAVLLACSGTAGKSQGCGCLRSRPELTVDTKSNQASFKSASLFL